MRKSIIVSLLLIAAFSCKIHEPNLPSWDTQWSLYLPTEDFQMAEIIDEDSALVADTTMDGTPIIKFELSDSTDWERVNENELSIGEKDRHFLAEIGEISLGEPVKVKSEDLTVEEILPSYLLAQGDTLPPYDTLTIRPELKGLEFENYRRVHVKEGYIWLTFYNETFLRIREGLKINIYNNDDTQQLIGKLKFNEPIARGDTVRSSILDISDKVISNQFLLEYVIPIDGSDTSRVVTEADLNSSCYSVLTMDEITVNWADAKIPEQQIVQRDSLDISDEKHRLRTATIEQGMMNFSINNHLPINANVTLELPNFRKDDQNKIVRTKILANEKVVKNVALNGYQLTHHETPGSFINEIIYDVTADVDSSDGYVYISSQDSVTIDLHTDSLFFASLSGEIAPVEQSISPREIQSIDAFSDIKGNMRLEDLIMTFDFYNQIDIPISVEMDIVGYRRDEASNQITDSAHVNLSEQINPASTSEVTRIVIDKNTGAPNSIVDLIEILPTEMKVSGRASIAGEGSISAGEGIRAVYKIKSPLSINISEPLIYETEVDSLTDEDLDEDEREQIRDDLSKVRAHLQFNNGIALGAGITLYLATDPNDLYNKSITDSSRKVIIKADIMPAQPGNNGYVETSQPSDVFLNLSDRQLDIFQFSPLYMRQVLELKPTDGTVRFRQSDKIEIDGSIEVKMIMNNE